MMRIAVAGATGVVGSYAAAAAIAQGHEVIKISRSAGIDVVTGEGLAQALENVGAMIDATNSPSPEEGPATEFFTAAVGNLQRLGREAGVRRLVVLSIVGIDRAPTGYYAAKLAHEAEALAGSVPVTVLRATQFHEYAAQMLAWNEKDGIATVPNGQVQTVAARTVGEVLAHTAAVTESPAVTMIELTGPEQANLPDLSAQFARQVGWEIQVQAVDSDAPNGLYLPGSRARVAGPSFEQWLTGPDAAAVANRLRGGV